MIGHVVEQRGCPAVPGNEYLQTQITFRFSFVEFRRFFHPLAGRPDEFTAERLDGDPGAEHRVPLAALRGRDRVRRGLRGGRGAGEDLGPAGPARGHPAAGAALQEAAHGEGGVCLAQSYRPRQLR